jgi:hypothetical protein
MAEPPARSSRELMPVVATGEHCGKPLITPRGE